MTGVDIQNEALEINHKLNGHPSFKASCTWLRNFKERYRITTKDIRENFQPTIPFIVGKDFKADFNRLLEEGGFTLKNVYNVAYTIVMWKAVSEETCILNHAESTGSIKMCDGYLFACTIWFEVQKKLLFYNSNTFIIISSNNQDSTMYGRQGKARNVILVFTFSLNFIL
ncbi:uncharacterized protein LOC143303104 [Bombus vancouverensis nearcticus]|uniref:uncharacterized protein LOC143303104 n=1 Tax=Bombus vancouverensis nearcticus TaxID=2705178 RepID=UPI00402B5454